MTATNAYDWHRACSCQSPKPAGWRQIRGRGAEGEWASAWLDWLWRTHIEPRGFRLRGRPSKRMLEVDIADAWGLSELQRAIASAPSSQEAAPKPPFDPTRFESHAR